MNKIVCDSCSHRFSPAPPQNAAATLIAEREFFDVAPKLRDAEIALCPKCGHSQKAQTYKFFGLLSASAVRVLIALIVFGMHALAVWWTTHH